MVGLARPNQSAARVEPYLGIRRQWLGSIGGYTADLQAILFALEQAYQSQERKVMIFSDSLSALQTLGKLKAEHPLLIQTQELLHKINADQKTIFF